MNEKCDRVFNEEEIKKCVDEEIFKKYTKFKIIQMKMVNKNFVNCPFTDCEEIVETAINFISGLSSVNASSKEYFVECQKMHKFCAKCKILEWHEDKKCSNVKIFKFLV